jgi:hypothetical protein
VSAKLPVYFKRPGKLALASATRNPGNSDNLDTGFRRYDCQTNSNSGNLPLIAESRAQKESIHG